MKDIVSVPLGITSTHHSVSSYTYKCPGHSCDTSSTSRATGTYEKQLETLQPGLWAEMRAVLFYALLMLLIAMETIMLGAHSMKESRSEGQSNPGGCISDWRGLKKAYFDHQSSADVENSIFDFYPSDASDYSVLVMFYDVGPPPNTSTSGRRECCQRGSKNCIIHFIYRFRIFGDIYPWLLRNFALVTNLIRVPKRNMDSGLRPLCWAPPGFCEGTSAGPIMMEFSKQVIKCNTSQTLYGRNVVSVMM